MHESDFGISEFSDRSPSEAPMRALSTMAVRGNLPAEPNRRTIHIIIYVVVVWLSHRHSLRLFARIQAGVRSRPECCCELYVRPVRSRFACVFRQDLEQAAVADAASMTQHVADQRRFRPERMQTPRYYRRHHH